MKITEITGVKAIETIGLLLNPVTAISQDPKTKELYKNDSTMNLIQYIMIEHAEDIHEILALLNGKTVAEYQPNALEMYKEINELMNDEEIMNLFV